MQPNNDVNTTGAGAVPGTNEAPNTEAPNTINEPVANKPLQAPGDALVSSLAETPAESEAPAVESKTEKKGGKGMLIGLILCLLLAVGGVGFGVWEMMDANSQKDSLNQQISSLKSQVNTLTEENEELQATIEILQTATGGTSSELPEWGTAVGALEDGVFYVKNSKGETVIEDDYAKATEIIECDSGNKEAGINLTCTVMAEDGKGQYTYNYEDGSLEFIYLDDVIEEE